MIDKNFSEQNEIALYMMEHCDNKAFTEGYQIISMGQGGIVMEYTEENYEFKKAIGQIIKDDFTPLLRANGFKKYGSHRYIRERSELVQVIGYSLGVAELKMWASVFPLCGTIEQIMTNGEYGINLMGYDGWKMLGGKYYTTMYGEPWEKKSVQLKLFYEKNQVGMQKLLEAIRLGVLPEFDRVNSFECFVELFGQKKPVFMGWEFNGERTAGFGCYKYVVAVQTCKNGDFQTGVRLLKEQKQEWMYSALDDYKMKHSYLLPQSKEVVRNIRLLLTPEVKGQALTHETFCRNYELLCNEKREKLKLIKKRSKGGDIKC